MDCRKCNKPLPEGASFCCWCGISQTPPARAPRKNGNGLGSVYKRPDRAGWCAAYTVAYVDGANGKSQKRKVKSGFRTKKEAQEYLSGVIAGLQDRKTKRVPTVAELYQQYVDAPGKKPGAGTMMSYKTAFVRRINPAFGDKPIDAVTLQDLELSVSGLKYDGAKDVKDLMSNLFRRAFADGFVQVNPVPMLQLPENHVVETIPWSPSEIESLWRAYGDGDRIASACLLMIYTGMMPGELFRLKSSMIDWDAHTILGCGLKTKERRERPIVLSDSVLPVLADLCATSTSRTGFVLGIEKKTFYRRFADMKDRLRIRPEIRPYSSRHTTATELELLGVSPSVIANVLRHRNYATTAKHYITISNDKALEAVNLIATASKTADV